MKQALDAITNVLAGGDFDNPYADLKQAGAALKQAIAEAEEQEPVGYVSESGKGAYLLVGVDLEDDTPLYATPLKREWVGLTDDEFQACFDHADGTLGSLMYAIEVKLKEKNT
jgi:uncharacterized UPF0160 family protein